MITLVSEMQYPLGASYRLSASTLEFVALILIFYENMGPVWKAVWDVDFIENIITQHKRVGPDFHAVSHIKRFFRYMS